MECVEEALSHSQVQAQKKAEKEYQTAKKEIELAKASAAAAAGQASAVTAPLPAPQTSKAARPPGRESLVWLYNCSCVALFLLESQYFGVC